MTPTGLRYIVAEPTSQSNAFLTTPAIRGRLGRRRQERIRLARRLGDDLSQAGRRHQRRESGGQHARRMLTQTLTWQGAYVVTEFGIEAPRTKSDDNGGFTDPGTVDAISQSTALLVDSASMSPTELRQLALRVVDSLGIETAHVITEL